MWSVALSLNEIVFVMLRLMGSGALSLNEIVFVMLMLMRSVA